MNKTELVKSISEKAQLKVSDTENLVNSFIDTVTEELKNKGKVTLVGFGTFSIAHRKEKTGVNPKTGKKIKIKSKNVPVFKAGKALKEKIK
ncbi:MAG: HU family DNA-binding protein [Candidatus Aminicenantes bacterium]|nr:HU family DNA-binding protein [Candidatus Aminicenantes bacterium]MCK5221345.1 HU family DNA-binding protein [Candidatus Aminicenantes bacterium]